VPRGSTVPLRAILATALALGLVLAFAAVASAAPFVTIDSGPSAQTRETLPSFDFSVDSALTVDCSLDQGIEAYAPCTSPYTATSLLEDGDWTFRIQASDGVDPTVETWSFTVDTVARLSIASGPAGPTNNTTPTFEFNAEAGATLECSVDGEPYAGCTSATTHVVGAPLSEGPHTFRVQATDTLGNQRELSRAFVVDTVRPTVDVISGPPGPTNDKTPTFGFTAEARAALQCSIDTGTPDYGDCTTASTHTATALADGSYVFHVQATDAAGNRAEASRRFDVDTVRPTARVTSGPTNTRSRTPSFEFTADAPVQCSVDRGTSDYGDCTTASTHTATALADGSYTFRVLARDAAGNQTEAVWRFTVDSAAPALSIDSGPADSTNDTTPSFVFTTEASTSTECSIDTGTPVYEPCTNPYTPASPLPEGTYTFRVHSTDRAGNDAGEVQSFTIDTTPPTLSITLGPTGTTGDSTPLFQFAAEAGATLECSIDQGTPMYGPCASATTHATVAPLADGAYTFRVRATDRATNQTTATRAFTVDTVPETPGPESPRLDPTPPVTPPVTTPTPPTPTKPQLLSPFPLVRISGTLTSRGARIRLLTVRASPGTLVRVTVSPPCSSRRHSSRRCRVVQAAGTVGRRAVIGFRGLEHAYRSGTVIVVRVWRADRIGKYTRFTIVRGKAPRRVDQCLVPEATSGSRCPTG